MSPVPSRLHANVCRSLLPWQLRAIIGSSAISVSTATRFDRTASPQIDGPDLLLNSYHDCGRLLHGIFHFRW